MKEHQLLISLGRESFSNVTVNFEGTGEEAIVEGKRLLSFMQGGAGLPDKEWIRVLDRYLGPEATMSADEYSAMNSTQQAVIQEIKKSRKRTK